MIGPLTIKEDRRRRQRALYGRTHQEPCPDKFRAIAEWWRISAEESRIPEEHLSYAASQDALANDMEAHPENYAVLMPGETHWEKFQKVYR